MYFFKATTFPCGLWAEYICTTTPPPLPHFALDCKVSSLESIEWSSLLDDPHPRLDLHFDKKTLWDFSSGSQFQALTADRSGHWSLQAQETYNSLDSLAPLPMKGFGSGNPLSILSSLSGSGSGGLGSILSSLTGMSGMFVSQTSQSLPPTPFPTYQTQGSKVYWSDMGLYGWLHSSRKIMTIELSK